MHLKGKTAFVTGAASGIGLAMARAFIDKGMNVILADIDEQRLAAIRNEMESDNTLLIALDVTNRDQFAEAAELSQKTFGNIHVLCNNAGVASAGAIYNTEFADWDRAMGINVDGVFNGVQAFIKPMMAHGEGGHIVNTSSLAGVIPVNDQVVYNTGKYAVMGLSESMRKDLAPHNIGVTVLCPGFVDTNIYTSDRPHKSGVEVAHDSSALSPEQQRLRTELIAKALNPAIVGIMVVKAIEANCMYLFTHPEFGQNVEKRAQRLSSGFKESADILSQASKEHAQKL